MKKEHHQNRSGFVNNPKTQISVSISEILMSLFYIFLTRLVLFGKRMNSRSISSFLVLILTTLARLESISASAPQEIDLNSLDAETGVQFINLDGAGALFGIFNHIADAGDINNDGRPDIVLGAVDGVSASKGEAYLLFGPQNNSWPLSVDVNNLNGMNGVRFFVGDGANNFLGLATASAGDVTGDGISDFLIGTDEVNSVRTTYLIFGQDSLSWPASIDLRFLNQTQGVKFTSSNPGLLSVGLSGLPDINGDGCRDMLISDRATTTGPGIVSLVYGCQSWGSIFSLDTMTSEFGAELRGRANGHRFGITIGSAGDVNHDGISDFLIAADKANPLGRSEAGEVYLFFGRNSSWPAVVDTNHFNSTDGILFQGKEANYKLGSSGCGFSVKEVKDVNDDGMNDFVIGSSEAKSSDGEAYLFFGRGDWPAIFDLSDFNQSHGVVIYSSDTANTYFVGDAVAGPGDVYADSKNDLLIGAFSTNARGEIYVISGRSTEAWPASLDLGSINATDDIMVIRGASNNELGCVINSMPDSNGDGKPDFLLGGDDIAYIIFGNGTLQTTTTSPTTTASTTLQPTTVPQIETTTREPNSMISSDVITTSTSSVSSTAQNQVPKNVSGGNNNSLLLYILLATGLGISCAGGIFGACFMMRKHNRNQRDKSRRLTDREHITLQVFDHSSQDSQLGAYTRTPAPGSIGGTYSVIQNPGNSQPQVSSTGKQQERSTIQLYSDIGKMLVGENGQKNKFLLLLQNASKLGQGQSGEGVRKAINTTGDGAMVAIKSFATTRSYFGELEKSKKINACGSNHLLKQVDYIAPEVDQSTGELTHPGYIIYESLHHDGKKLINMWSDTDLQSKLSQLTNIARDLCSGLQSMHKNGIYHMDMKPANFMLDDNRRAVIIDFDCSAESDDDYVSGGDAGDMEYFSPQRVDKHRHYFHEYCYGQYKIAANNNYHRIETDSIYQTLKLNAAKEDAWALGVSLLEIIIGYNPFTKSLVEDSYLGLALMNKATPDYYQNIIDEVTKQHPWLTSKTQPLAVVISSLLKVDDAERMSVTKALNLLNQKPTSQASSAALFAVNEQLNTTDYTGIPTVPLSPEIEGYTSMPRPE